MNILQQMRKPYFAIFLSSIMFLASCSKQEDVISDETSANYTVPIDITQSKVDDKELINSFVDLQNSRLNDKLPINIEFDNDNIFEVSSDANASSMIIATQVGYDENNKENYTIGATITKSGLASPIIIRTSKISDKILKIEYLTSAFELISSIELNSNTETISTFDGFQKIGNLELSKSCGQMTMDCLADAYTNHGWISVWATVQTAFIPATAAALAAACAVNECL
jgi:hypothetical protein